MGKTVKFKFDIGDEVYFYDERKRLKKSRIIQAILSDGYCKPVYKMNYEFSLVYVVEDMIFISEGEAKKCQK